MKALISGFDPFGGETINPAFQAVKRLPDKIGQCTVVKLEVPTVFNRSLDVLLTAIERQRPDFVIGVGQAGGRFAIAPEVVAINKDDARIADNAGNRPNDVKIVADGATAYFSTLPNKAIVKSLKAANIPAKLSYTAGTFVCNHLFYGLMHAIATRYPDMRGGFIHVPYCAEQVVEQSAMPFMSIAMIAEALQIAIATTAQNAIDIDDGGGALD